MNFRLHDCKNQGKATLALGKREKELYECLRKDHCDKHLHYGNTIFCKQSPLFEQFQRKEGLACTPSGKTASASQ